MAELLVKYIFTSESLSIQVHPDDSQTEAIGRGRQRKSECWYVIDADPGAMLGIGFREKINPNTLRSAAIDGSIVEMLVWHEVNPGDFFYIPANTVHAIGAGVSLIEIQQNSNITYRLYDYDRPRELHLDEGLAIARREAYDLSNTCRVPNKGTVRLVDGPFFVLDRLEGPITRDIANYYSGSLLVIPLSEGVSIEGQRVDVGQCALTDNISAVGASENSLYLLTRRF